MNKRNGLKISSKLFMQSEQMAKAFSSIQNKKRIKENLLNLQRQKNQEIRQNSLRLKQKMQGYEKKRQTKFNEKLQTFKLNEEKWTKRIQSIEKKFKHQNREAIQKAEKYRQQSENYWKQKQIQLATSRRTSYQKFDLNKTQQMFGKNQIQSNLIRKNTNQNILTPKTSKYLEMKAQNFAKLNFISSNSDNQRGYLKNSRTIDIDEQIYKHRQKSQLLQKQKEKLIFQNAMKRLEKIQESRKKVEKLKQPSKSPVQIRKPKKNQINDDDLYQVKTERKNQSLHATKSKECLLDENIQNHIKAKRFLEEQEIKERDKILENNQKKKRKDKILKAIKEKIKDLKSSTLKMQTLQ